jgi:hypothetical protein
LAFVTGILVEQVYGRAELDLFAGQLRHVDDLRPGDLVLELGDAASR